MESTIQNSAIIAPDKEVSLINWNKWFRQTHRWFSIAFTLGFIANGVAVKLGKYNGWVGLSALIPLVLLLLTGLYLFALPYATRWRNARRTGSNA